MDLENAILTLFILVPLSLLIFPYVRLTKRRLERKYPTLKRIKPYSLPKDFLLCFIFIYLCISSYVVKDNTRFIYMGLLIVFSFWPSFRTKKYYNCPYCDKSILMYETWQCHHCHEIQKKPSLCFEKCQICGRYQETAVCEHCKWEFII